ncbi:MAG TPA: hypothetical protein VF719_06010, partial [Abditibacteriaceae bacterium]
MTRSKSPHLGPLAILLAVCTLYWSRVLFTGEALLPGAFLRGFAPFGSDPQAPWNLLRWDALGQYYPWRLFAAQQLQSGLIPLWNPHQFAGAPFVANGQSAVFYPLNLPFWLMDVARAFGVSAWLHSLLACAGTYFLAQRWKMSRAASILSALAFGFCGYLTTWVMLPTLANTASWLPLLILLFDIAATHETDDVKPNAAPGALALFSLVFGCTLLAGHAQIFIYCGMALALRAATLPHRLHTFKTLFLGSLWTVALAAIQVFPTL